MLNTIRYELEQTRPIFIGKQKNEKTKFHFRFMLYHRVVKRMPSVVVLDHKSMVKDVIIGKIWYTMHDNQQHFGIICDKCNKSISRIYFSCTISVTAASHYSLILNVYTKQKQKQKKKKQKIWAKTVESLENSFISEFVY